MPRRKFSRFVGVLSALLLVSSAVAAAPKNDSGHGKGGNQKAEHQSDGHGRQMEESEGRGGKRHFVESDYAKVHDYYVSAARGGHCPPGLAKKHNGCMPPGQARKWVVGRPLPRDVVYYAVPPALVVQLTPPPVGYRYVRVASDILMIAAGTGMVVDAIQDLGAR